MHFSAIRAGTVVVIRTPEGPSQGRAVRREGDSWVLDNGLTATPANVVRFVRAPRRGTPRGESSPEGQDPS
jgi:hypothetical protein